MLRNCFIALPRDFISYIQLLFNSQFGEYGLKRELFAKINLKSKFMKHFNSEDRCLCHFASFFVPKCCYLLHLVFGGKTPRWNPKHDLAGYKNYKKIPKKRSEKLLANFAALNGQGTLLCRGTGKLALIQLSHNSICAERYALGHYLG